MKKLFLTMLLLILCLSFVNAKEISILDKAVINEPVVSDNTMLTEDIKILPDNPFYGIKRAFEDLNLAFTLQTQKKTEKALELANKRISEIQLMSEKGKTDNLDKVKKAHEQALEKVKSGIAFIKEIQGDPEEEFETVVRLENKIKEHEEKVLKLKDIVHSNLKIKLSAEQEEKLNLFFQSLEENTELAKNNMANEKEKTRERLKNEQGYTDEGVDNKLAAVEKSSGLSVDKKANAISALKDADVSIAEAKIRIDKTKDLLCLKTCYDETSSSSCISKCLTVDASYKQKVVSKQLSLVTANVVLNESGKSPKKNESNEMTPCGDDDFIVLCHKPGTSAEQTLTVANSAVRAHLSHGDYCGACVEEIIEKKMTFKLDFDGSMVSTDGESPLKSVGTPKFSDDAVSGKALTSVSYNEYYEYLCDENFNHKEGSVLAWIKFDTFSWDAVIWHTDDSKYVMYYDRGSRNGYKAIKGRVGQESNEPNFKFDLQDTPTNEPNTWLNTGWHFIAMTWNGSPTGTSKLYVDGELKDTKSYTGGEDCYTFRVGNNYWPGMSWANGKIDELEVYNYALESGEVLKSYDKFGNHGSDSGEQFQCQNAGLPSEEFCKEGIISPVKDDNGCIEFYDCTPLAAEPENETAIEMINCSSECDSDDCIEACADAQDEVEAARVSEEDIMDQLEVIKGYIQNDYDELEKIILSEDSSDVVTIKNEDISSLSSQIVSAEKYLEEAIDLRTDAMDALNFGD
ncbi:MAG: hypothetical protein KKF89_05990, partial [Nanoarchaeota archaeon]|nr:hypothetical protein [Nanoarchaeota archaeon]